MRFGVVMQRGEYGHEHAAVFGLESGSNVRTAAPVVGKTVRRLGGLRGVRRGIKRALLRQNFAMNLQRRMAGRSARGRGAAELMVASLFSCGQVLNEYNISFIISTMGSISASISIIIAGAAEMHVRQGFVSMHPA